MVVIIKNRRFKKSGILEENERKLAMPMENVYDIWLTFQSYLTNALIIFMYFTYILFICMNMTPVI